MKLDSKLVYTEPEVNFEIGIDEAIKRSEDNLNKLTNLSLQAFANHP